VFWIEVKHAKPTYTRTRIWSNKRFDKRKEGRKVSVRGHSYNTRDNFGGGVGNMQHKLLCFLEHFLMHLEVQKSCSTGRLGFKGAFYLSITHFQAHTQQVLTILV